MAISNGSTVVERKSGTPQLDCWGSMFQTLNKDQGNTTGDSCTPYVHPLVKMSKNSMNQKSLEVCTESLGSETGSDGFSDLDDFFGSSLDHTPKGEVRTRTVTAEMPPEEEENSLCKEKTRELASVNYHCSIGRRSNPRPFPPPLPSISRRDGPCVQMRRHWQDGRLVMVAVPVPSQNYLHWQREGGRLVLSFIETSFQETYHQEVSDDDDDDDEQTHEEIKEEEIDEEEKEEEEDEEVEVVDRGIVVEVKLLKSSRPPLVINKFVGGTPLGDLTRQGITAEKAVEEDAKLPGKTPFTLKRLVSRQASPHQVRGCCDYQHRQLFILEACCVAST